jgi:PEP-CTERM motif
MTRMRSFALLGAALLGLSNTASAGLVYINGNFSGQISGYTINFGFQVTDSFTVTDPGGDDAGSFDFIAWNFPGDVISAVDWSIGTAAFGSDIGSGAGAPVIYSQFIFENGQDYNIFSDKVSLGAPIYLAPGTYYLTLQNAVASNGDPAYWDENDGPSLAFENTLGAIGSESFDVLTPEPGSLMLFGSGLLLVAGAWRRKARR